ncbi:hypothetical protein, partial [Kineococcus endophyticus]
ISSALLSSQEPDAPTPTNPPSGGPAEEGQLSHLNREPGQTSTQPRSSSFRRHPFDARITFGQKLQVLRPAWGDMKNSTPRPGQLQILRRHNAFSYALQREALLR